MSDDQRVRGVLLGHGKMAEGMVDAVRKIAGLDEDALVPLSNEGCNPQTLAAEISELVGDAPTVVFTDLCTGSCAMSAQLTCRNNGHRAVVFGVNLPMLLDFVFHRELPLDELIPRLVEKGMDSVKSVLPSE